MLVTPYPPCYHTAVGWLVKAPARFLLTFLLIWALVALVVVVDILATRDVDQLAGTLPVAETLVFALLLALTPAVLLTLALQLMTIRRSQDRPIVVRTLFFFLAGALLLGGFYLFGGSYRGFAGRLASVGLDVEGSALYRSGDGSLYVSETQTLRLRNVVFVPRGFGETMELTPETQHLPGPDREIGQLPGREGPFFLREAYGGPWRGPRKSIAFAGLVDDLTRLTEDLLRFPALSRGFLLRVSGMLLFVVTAWVFLRLTRWPLFNAFLFLLALRGMLWIPRGLENPVFREAAQAYLGPELFPVLPYTLFLGLSGLFVLVNLLLPGLSHWERETLDG